MVSEYKHNINYSITISSSTDYVHEEACTRNSQAASTYHVVDQVLLTVPGWTPTIRHSHHEHSNLPPRGRLLPPALLRQPVLLVNSQGADLHHRRVGQIVVVPIGYLLTRILTSNVFFSDGRWEFLLNTG